MSKKETPTKKPYNKSELLAIAEKARNTAYAPYSETSVGAALLLTDGTVYTGANVENASSPVGICAERVAFLRALMDGRRDFSAIAVSGGRLEKKATSLFAPCGMCRQFMLEFCKGEFEIILMGKDCTESYTLSEILPLGFDNSKL